MIQIFVTSVGFVTLGRDAVPRSLERAPRSRDTSFTTAGEPSGDCGSSSGAEVSGEVVAEFLVLGPPPADLVAVGPQLLAQRVGGQSRADEVNTHTSATVSHRTALAEPDEEDTDQENASTTRPLTQRSDVEDTLRPPERLGLEAGSRDGAAAWRRIKADRSAVRTEPETSGPGPAPVRRFLPELIEKIWTRQIQPRQGVRPDPAAGEGRGRLCRNGYDRTAIKVLLQP